jgi:hypothetical protein
MKEEGGLFDPTRRKEEGGLFDPTRCLTLTQQKQKSESRNLKSEI